jgi:hypothetical protein
MYFILNYRILFNRHENRYALWSIENYLSVRRGIAKEYDFARENYLGKTFEKSTWCKNKKTTSYMERECDINREVSLSEFGIEIIRFTNDKVINEMETVIEKLQKKINELKQKQIQKITYDDRVGQVPFRGFRGEKAE